MRIRLIVIAVICLAATRSFAIDTKVFIDRALEQLDAHRYGLARAYLDPVAIDASAPADKRAQAYYLRGHSFAAEGLYVSAAGDYESALDLAPGAVGPSKRWPVYSYAEVAQRLTAEGIAVFVLGGPDEKPLAAKSSPMQPGVQA